MSKVQKIMMINVTHTEESRVAVVADGVLDTFEIETVDRQALKGNIYKGKVESLHSGLQAAFVDIGQERSGFLPLDEINFEVNPSRKDSGKGHRIEDHLQKGEELIVQVVKDQYGTKPPTLSTYFSLPGRFMVVTPYQKTEGISRKLSDKQRERIRKILEDLQRPEHMGCIVRTAGGTQTKAEVQRDLRYLLRLWENIEAAAKKKKAPCLVYQERNLALRTIRDLFTPDIDEVWVDDPKTHEQIVDFFKTVMPQKQKIVKPYQGSRPIFNRYNLEDQIENIFKRRIPLPSGGALVFDQTEALIAVDVNSGKMTRGDIEEIALKTNLEAAEEIARQLRLRDLAGLVVIDFIDMRAAKNVREVEKAMRDAMRKDKARYDITRLSRLGLMEISRERLRPAKSSARYMDCPSCEGTGSIKTIEAAALQALRKIQTRVVRGDLEKIELMVPPDVATYVLNHKRAEIASLEHRYHCQVQLSPRSDYGRDDVEMETTARTRGDREQDMPLVGDADLEKIEAEVAAEQAREKQTQQDEPVAPAPVSGEAGEASGDQAEAAGEAGAPTASRRRRRRRRRKPAAERTAAAEGEEAPAGEPAATPPKERQAVESEQAGTGQAEAAPGNGSSRRRRRRRRRPRSKGEAAGGETPAADRPPRDKVTEQPALPLAAMAEPRPSVSEPSGKEKPRSSWWARLTGKDD